MPMKYDEFLDEFMRRLEVAGVDVSKLEMDHIAYKTASEEEYFQMKPDFEHIGVQVHENMVRGRRVGIFQLIKPLTYKQYSIPAMELIAPLEGETVVSGWEHAEFVLTESYEKFMKMYPKLKWDTSVMNSDLFSMIKLKLGPDMQAKFHQMAILKVIEEEKKI